MSPSEFEFLINPLKPNDPYRGRTAPLNSKVAFYIFIQQIQVLNIFNIVCTLCFFHLQIAVCFIILTYFFPVLFTFYIQDVLTPNDPYTGRTATLITKFCIIYIYIYSTNIGTEYFKNDTYSPFIFSLICSLFHNSNVFGSCIIYI